MNDGARRAEEGTAGIFGRAAAIYDRIGRFPQFGQRLVELAQLAPGDTVLDVAAGRGAVTFPAAKRVGPRGRVIGIDISTEMLREFYRVLKPGGRLGITTWAEDSPMHRLNRQALPRPRLARSGSTSRLDAHRFDTREQLEAAFGQAEFRQSRILAEGRDIVVAEEEALWENIWTTGARQRLEGMTASELERVKAGYYRKLQGLR